MAVAFGFSLGDFIAITKLVKDIYDAVKAANDLRAEVQALADSYKLLFSSLQVALDSNLGHGGRIEAATRNGLELHLQRCRQYLESFFRQILPFTDSSVRQGLANAVKQASKRVSVARHRKVMFQELNDNVSRELKAFQFYVSALAGDRQCELLQSSQDTAKATASNSETINALVHILGSMPKELGYTWEGGKLRQQVTLFQGSGAIQIVPLDVCRNLETFRCYLLAEKDYPGRRRIAKGHYRLINHDTGSRIISDSQDAWNQVIRPGLKISLSVVIGSTMYAKSLMKQCPRCISYRLVNGVYAQTKRCEDCALVFDSVPIEDFAESQEPIDSSWDWAPFVPGKGPDLDNVSSSSGVVKSSANANPYDTSQSVTGRRGENDEDDDDCDDYENALQRVTMVYSPIFNWVFRSTFCRCRLAGDASPFANDLDFLWDAPCRLHFFDGVAEYGIKLEKPDIGYNPEEDPYFDKYGGHLAFAAYISCHPMVMRSVDIGKLVPPSREEEAVHAMERALQAPEYGKELQALDKEIAAEYFRWRRQHGKKHAEHMKKIEKQRQPYQKPRRQSL